MRERVERVDRAALRVGSSCILEGAVKRLLCIVIALGACVSAPRPPPAPPRETAIDLAISNIELSNGLRVVVVRDPKAEEVQVTMRYAVGATDDPVDRPGTAHLVEHLMFQQVLGSQSLFAHLETVATYFNAFTTADGTTYIARARPVHLDKLLSIEAVRMGFRCTSITDSVFTREREVVVQEERLRDRHTELLTAAHSALYPDGHAYRRLGASGAASITREQACEFADAHYAPSKAVLVISGNIDKTAIVTALQKFLGKLPSRQVTPVGELPPALPSRTLTAPGPLDTDVVLLAWPLPESPEQRAQLEAIAPWLVSMIDARIAGNVIPFTLGGERAPVLSLFVVPGDNESVETVLARSREAISELPSALSRTSIPFLDALQFDTIRQTAIYSLMTSLDDSSERDTRIATYVLAGRDPKGALDAAAAGLRALRPETASGLALQKLGFGAATIITLQARQGKKTGTKLPEPAPIHDLGQRRSSVNISEAQKPANDQLQPRAVVGRRVRVLANGLRVVLLPLTSIPTVDIRLIFAAGSGDEGTKRGTALAAAKGLAWDRRYANDALRFIAAGGTDLVDVGLDHTTFTARGVDMHLDVLLAGLRRWVREGRYNFDNESLRGALRELRKRVDEDSALADAARAALFGRGHPYARAGVLHFASDSLTPEDAQRFRDAYYTPDNATLVIAGRFDADLADRWIDFLFADWKGKAQPRPVPPPLAATPASLVKIEDVSQVHLQLALPAKSGTRAHRLVAAAMLDEIAGEVRHSLAASYALSASYVERRHASEYAVAGWIDAARVGEAVQLLADRLAAVRADLEAGARAFVVARQRVLTRLGSGARTSALLGAQAEQEIALGREPLSDLRTAMAVHELTIDEMTDVLADLDLRAAVIAMRGPAAETERAFAVLGRKPTPISIDRAALDALEEVSPQASDARSSARDDDDFELAPPITHQPGPPTFMFSVAPSFTLASLGESLEGSTVELGTSGVSIAMEVAHRMTPRSMVGLQLGLGSLGGNYKVSGAPLTSGDHAIFDAFVVFHILAFDRIWGALLLGLHADRTHEFVVPSWYAAPAGGLQLDYDLVRRTPHRFALTARWVGNAGGDVSYSGVTIGVAYRRY